MKVVSVVGARPQFVKLPPIADTFAKAGVEHVILHTGQHYEATMSDVFFKDLHIPSPTVSLGIGSGMHGAQTGAMLAAIEPALAGHNPDWVLVYGYGIDTNSPSLSAEQGMHLPTAVDAVVLRMHSLATPRRAGRRGVGALTANGASRRDSRGR